MHAERKAPWTVPAVSFSVSRPTSMPADLDEPGRREWIVTPVRVDNSAKIALPKLEQHLALARPIDSSLSGQAQAAQRSAQAPPARTPAHR